MMASEILKNLLQKTFDERLNYLDRRSKDQIESLSFSAKEFEMQTKQVDKLTSENLDKGYESNFLLIDNNVTPRANRTSALLATSKATGQRQSPNHNDKSVPKRGDGRSHYKALTPGRTQTEPSSTRARTRTPLLRKEKTEGEPKGLSRGRTEKNLLAKPLKTVKLGPGKKNNDPTPLSSSKSQKTLGRGISPKTTKTGSTSNGKTGNRHSQMATKKDDLKNAMQLESESKELHISTIEVEQVKIRSTENEHSKKCYSQEKIDISSELQKSPWLETISSYLTPLEQLQFFSTKKQFRPNLAKVFANVLTKFEEKNGLFFGQTVEDKINEIKLKLKPDEFNKQIPPFSLTRGASKAIELLNEELYNRIFKQNTLSPPLDEIIIVYRIFCQLIGRSDLTKFEDNDRFWLACANMILTESKGKTGDYFAECVKYFDFSDSNISKLKELCNKSDNKISPSYYSKICGTTGLMIFLIKDALEYAGVLIQEKKTHPMRIIKNFEYLGETIKQKKAYLAFLTSS